MSRRLRGVAARWRLLVGTTATIVAVASVVATAAERSERLAVSAHLHYVDARGSYLIEEGQASGPLGGIVKARLRVTANISGSFTFYPRGGSISGRGVGTLHESGTYASFGGTVTVLGGTGTYAGAHGEGKLYGVYDRKTLGVTIQTTGTLLY
jgi:hypothetical protein